MSNSNRPGGTPLPTAAAPAIATSVNSITPSSNVPDAKSSTSASYQALENIFKQIAKVATDLLPAANREQKTDKDFYAISYGLILIDTLIKDTSRIADVAKNLPLICNKSGFVDSRSSQFSDIIKQISNIRNMLSDHFIRIPTNVQNSLYNVLGPDFERLGNFAAIEPQENEGCKLGTISAISNSLTKIQNLNVAYRDRVSYLLSSLKIIDNIKQQYNSHQASDKIHDQYAISMLYIVAGTCAREISAEAKRHDTPSSLNPALTVLAEIVKTRTDLGHYSYLGIDPKKFEETIMKINNANFTTAIMKEINLLYNIADPMKNLPFNEKSLIQLDATNAATAAATAAASHKPTISAIDAIKAKLAAQKQTASQQPPISDFKHSTPPSAMEGVMTAANSSAAIGGGASKSASAAVVIASGESATDAADALESRKKTMLSGLRQSTSNVINTLYDIHALMENLPNEQMSKEEKSFRNNIATKINELVGIELSNSKKTDKTLDSLIADYENLNRLAKAPEVASLITTFAQNFKSKFEQIAFEKANSDVTMETPPTSKK